MHCSACDSIVCIARRLNWIIFLDYLIHNNTLVICCIVCCSTLLTVIMPYKCCATGCNSNYDKNTEYVTVFRFPDDIERQRQWIRQIPRANLTVTKYTRICIKHFEERFIRRNYGVVPVLTDDSYPTVFQGDGIPTYISTPLPPARHDPDRRRVMVAERNNIVLKDFLDSDVIGSHSAFMQNMTVRLKTYIGSGGQWAFHCSPGATYLYIFKEEMSDGIPGVAVCVKVNSDMRVALFVKNIEMPPETLGWILGDEFILGRWSQCENILSHYSSYSRNSEVTADPTVRAQLLKICTMLDSIVDAVGSSEDDSDDDAILVKVCVFCAEQLRLACVASTQRRYSSHLLRFAFLLFTRSSACYRILYSSDVIILPHTSTLRRISTVLTVVPGSENLEQVNFLKLRSSQLKERERFVVLQMDEIHVNPALSYKNGAISGAALNSSTMAHSVQAFLIASIFGNAKEVVSLTPVRNLTASNLHSTLTTVIHAVQLTGFVIVAIAADNNQVNCKAYELLGGSGKLEFSVQNPTFPDQRIFLLFDTVHILKCIRNNWLNVKDQSFLYPRLPDNLNAVAALLNSREGEPTLVTNVETCSNAPLTPACPVTASKNEKQVAAVERLKALYQSERNSLIKKAPKLSYKTLYPTSLERQQVGLVLNVFNEFNVIALQQTDCESDRTTAAFIQLITAWWRIVNVKHFLKGFRKRDDLSTPIKNDSDFRLQFFEHFGQWLQEWGSGGKGCLTHQTLRALQHTSLTFIELTKYVLNKLGMKYILLGKLQTDMIERRFGEYRQLSGGNYNVSVQQVLESEKKLRVSSLLALSSSKLGYVAITDIRDALAKDDTAFDLTSGSLPDDFFYVPFELLDCNVTCDEQVLTYVCGYVVHKYLATDSCSSCVLCFAQDRQLTLSDEHQPCYDYISDLDRGGLKYPTLLSVMFAYKVFCAVQLLVSDDYETKFLCYKQQKALVCCIVKEAVNIDDFFVSEATEACCVCGSSPIQLLCKMLPTFVNIFLNNYTKECNDNHAASGGKKGSRKRKLETLV